MSRRTQRPEWTKEKVLALGVTTGLVTAGEILGMGRSKAHAMARAGEFPVPVHRVGNRYVVPLEPVLEMLQLCPVEREKAGVA